ncbi:MAG: hypothetical protein M5U08_25380 [Burkholderiales bacterium]|nr:hypothetical protein [Burkholderiales bacterium]
MKLGISGLWRKGLPMMQRPLARGAALSAWNRDPAKLAEARAPQ